MRFLKLFRISIVVALSAVPVSVLARGGTCGFVLSEMGASEDVGYKRVFYGLNKEVFQVYDIRYQKLSDIQKYSRSADNSFALVDGRKKYLLESGDRATLDIQVIDLEYIMPVAKISLSGRVISSFLNSDGKLAVLTSDKILAIVDTNTWQVLLQKRVSRGAVSVTETFPQNFVLKTANGYTYETINIRDL